MSGKEFDWRKVAPLEEAFTLLDGKAKNCASPDSGKLICRFDLDGIWESATVFRSWAYFRVAKSRRGVNILNGSKSIDTGPFQALVPH